MLKKQIYLDLLFISFILIYITLGLFLITNIPYDYPYGGPDEPIHLSMISYISKFQHWAYWDSLEIARSPYGVSYTPGSSIVYWLHAISYKISNFQRSGPFITLLIYLSTTIFIYLKNKTAGFFLLSGLIPQALFIFSYVNSDSGTILSALLFGLGVARYVSKPDKLTYFFILFFFAGFTVTSRQHLWPISLATLLFILFTYRTYIYSFSLKYIILALFIALLPASWWFYTSYIYNNHDILGISINSKSILAFSQSGLPSMDKPWNEFSLYEFTNATWRSFYGIWGWLNIDLNTKYYLISTFTMAILYFSILKKMQYKFFILVILLVIINFSFMMIYSIFYDYQAQGRYMFPSFYTLLGVLVGGVIFTTKKTNFILWISIVLIIFNIIFSLKLMTIEYYNTSSSFLS